MEQDITSEKAKNKFMHSWMGLAMLGIGFLFVTTKDLMCTPKPSFNIQKPTTSIAAKPQ